MGLELQRTSLPSLCWKFLGEQLIYGAAIELLNWASIVWLHMLAAAPTRLFSLPLCLLAF